MHSTPPGSHVFNYPGSIALQYEAEAVRLAALEGAGELPHWTHAESIACHQIMAQVIGCVHVTGESGGESTVVGRFVVRRHGGWLCSFLTPDPFSRRLHHHWATWLHH